MLVRSGMLTDAVIPACGEVDLIVDGRPFDGRHNMAVDAALLETGLVSDRCVVRIYRWCEPTVTVGHFQRQPDRLDTSLQSLPVVRRLSGGGAILHDCEVTYSCVVPASHPLHAEPSRLYGIVHRALIRLLEDCGCPARLRSDREIPPVTAGSATADPFLCFLRTDPNDIVFAGNDGASMVLNGPIKIVGSAQRRRRGTVLQHGSILLAASPLLADVPGIHQLCPRFNEPVFLGSLGERIGLSLGNQLRFRDLLTSEKRSVDERLAGGGESMPEDLQ